MKQLLTAKDIASMLGVSVTSVRRWQRAGKMPAPVIHRHRMVRWRREKIDEWIDKGCPRAKG